MISILIFICMGSPFLIGGGIWWLYNLLFLLRAEETTGLIVGYKTSRGKNNTSSKPIVEFQGPNGETIQFTERMGSDSEGGGLEVLFILAFVLLARAFRKNTNEDETVKVVYDPNNPSRAHIKSFQYLHFIPLLLISIGGCISLLGIPVLGGYIQNFFNSVIQFLEKLPWWL